MQECKQQLEQAQQQAKEQSGQPAMSPKELLDNIQVKVWPEENGKCFVVLKIDDQTNLLQWVTPESSPKPHLEDTDKK